METLKLNSDGKVVIPGLGTGKKKITIKQLKDKISHIPDTNSIDVDIDSKQGLLPPERVTIKNEYPYQFKVQVRGSATINTQNTFWGIPNGCNGFIPDYIDTSCIEPGDRIYIVDPQHDDTSKYVLGDDKKWIYVGNYNDKEIGGVEGNDYSDINGTNFGGFWLVRQNRTEDINGTIYIQPFVINHKILYGNKAESVLMSYKFSKGDIVFRYDIQNRTLLVKQMNDFCKWITLTNQTFETLGIQDREQMIIDANKPFDDGYWRILGYNSIEWLEGNSHPGKELGEKLEQVIKGVDENSQYETYIMVNPFCHTIYLNDLIFDGTIDSYDRISLFFDNFANVNASRSIVYTTTKGWRMTTQISGKNGYTYNIPILPGQAFWYTRRGTTPLTIRFPESV